MPDDERATLGPSTSQVVTAVRDYVQALSSPNGHPMSAGQELERRLNEFATAILRLARDPKAPTHHQEQSTHSE